MAFRTQKISQMTPKGANLEATDLIEVSTIESGSYVTRSITGQEIIDAAVGNVDWGDIGGTLSAQTDLQSALDAKVPTSRTLTINGVTQDLSSDRTYTISTGITIGTTGITSGAVGRVLFEGAGNVVQESSSLFWDATNNRLGIGTSSPTQTLEVNGLSVFRDAMLFSLAGDRGLLTWGGGYFQLRSQATNGLILGLASSEAIRIPTTGNVLINTTTDAGFKLDVNGTARFALPANNAYGATISTDASGHTTFAKIGGGASLYFTSTQSIFLNPTHRVGIGNFSSVQPRTLLSVVGGDDSAPALGSANGKFSILNGTGTSGGYGLVFGVQGTGMSHIQSQRVDGSATAYALAIQPAGGNLLINTTTDAGFRLDVNGTARVSSNLTVSGTLVANLLRAANLNESMILYQRRTATSGDGFSLFDNNVVNGSNININILNIGGSYGTSGTCVHNNLLISREINLASGTQTVRGIYYNPTLTNTTGLTTHYAIHTAVGRIRFENLPTSSAGLSSGDLWNNLGVLMIV